MASLARMSCAICLHVRQARREAEEAVRVLHEAARRAEAKRRAHEAAAAERER